MKHGPVAGNDRCKSTGRQKARELVVLRVWSPLATLLWQPTRITTAEKAHRWGSLFYTKKFFNISLTVMHTLPADSLYLFYMPILSNMVFKVEVVICEMGEAECFLRIWTDTRSWFIQLAWEINEVTFFSSFFCYSEFQQKTLRRLIYILVQAYLVTPVSQPVEILKLYHYPPKYGSTSHISVPFSQHRRRV